MTTRDKIRDYYRRNPDEYLTINDLALKLGISHEAAQQAVKGLQELGELATDRFVFKRPGAKI
jgi:hypothetical protein